MCSGVLENLGHLYIFPKELWLIHSLKMVEPFDLGARASIFGTKIGILHIFQPVNRLRPGVILGS